MWAPIPDIGKYGIIRDVPSHLLPAGAWSDGENVRFRNGRVFRTAGSARIHGAPPTNILPIWGINALDETNSYWLYSTTTKLYSVLGTTHTNVTRQSGDPLADENYTVSLDDLWNGGNFSGTIVITNGSDVPQSWVPSSTLKAEDLSDWPSGVTCKIIRPFGYFLVALNLMESTEH